MIHTIIFDIGNVLAGYDPESYIYSHYEKEKADRLSEIIWHSGLWEEMDRGVIPDEEIMRRYSAVDPSMAEDVRTALDGIGGCMTAYPSSVPWLHRLHLAGCRLLYLSNYSDRMRRRSAAALSFLKEMDGGIFSCDVKLTKPDTQIFALLIRRYDLIPEECVFLDDSAPNIKKAASLGFHTILVASRPKAMQELDEMLKKHGNAQ